MDIPPLAPRIPTGVSADRLLASNLAALAACDLELSKRVALARPDALPGGVQIHLAASGVPTVVAGQLRVHSAFDPIAEAALQAGRVPEGAVRVMALGFGAGHLLAMLLARPQLARLDVVPLHLGVLRAVAASVDLKPLLCDPRLRFVADEKPALASPFVVVPPLLSLAEPARADLCRAALAHLFKECAHA